jgi:hypothetical protein
MLMMSVGLSGSFVDDVMINRNEGAEPVRGSQDIDHKCVLVGIQKPGRDHMPRIGGRVVWCTWPAIVLYERRPGLVSVRKGSCLRRSHTPGSRSLLMIAELTSQSNMNSIVNVTTARTLGLTVPP